MAFKISKFLVEFFLFTGYSLRGNDLHPDKKIPGFSAPFYTLTGDLSAGPVLDTGRDLQVDVALVDGFNLNCRPEDPRGPVLSPRWSQGYRPCVQSVCEEGHTSR